MRPRELVQAWVAAFNRGSAEEIAAFYYYYCVIKSCLYREHD